MALDPNNFVDVEAAFADVDVPPNPTDAPTYDPDEITFAEFEISQSTSLIYHREEWRLTMYSGFRYNGPDVRVGPQQAKEVLTNLADNRQLDEFDWPAQHWVHFE